MPLYLKVVYLLFMFATLFVLSQLFFNKASSFSYSSPRTLKWNPVHLLIVSSWRSGSSFLGQIFNHHSDVFYLFEPGHPIWMKFQHKSSEQLHYPLRNLLHSLYNCDMSPLRQYLPNGGNNINELTFFAETRALCTPPACSTFIPSEGYDRLRCYHRCRDTSLDKMAETCRMYSHVVMKTVRILDLSVLFTLLEDPALDLRILHLVRDPRAVALSRTYFILDIEDHIVLKKEGNENITISRVMEKICRSQVHINNVAKAAQALQGRYMAIRYEDLALEPLKSINKIYRFASLHPTEDLEQWAYNITHQEQEEKNGVMTFSRESSKVVQRWRTSLGFDFVEEIQESCKEAMVLFGYFPAQSKSEQRNLTLDLVDKEWSID